MESGKKQHGMERIIKNLPSYGLMLATATLAGQAQAATVDIAKLSMASTELELYYNNVTYNFSSTDLVEILMGTYQGSITGALTDGSGNTATIYSTSADSDPAPSGQVNDSLGELVNIDFSALRADFNLAGDSLSFTLWDSSSAVYTNIYDAGTSLFQYGWTTDISTSSGGWYMGMCMGGGGCGGTTTNTLDTALAGTVSTVPVPTALWLFGTGLIALGGIAKHKNTA
ncbi:MAG TPA: hypothetical protein ENJ08_03205 [Gammaproteobacteria bacterium]|nr:hypothetical protein [Gammaproteobacteria bacterium]